MDNSSHSRSTLHWHADADAPVPVVVGPPSNLTDETQHRLVLLAVIDVDYGYSELNTAIAAAAAERLREAFDEKDRPPAISNALRWAMMRALATAKQDTERLTGRSLTQISADAQLDGINMMAMVVNGNRIAIAHVGHCRLWGVRNGRSLYQIDYTAPKVEVTEHTFQTGDRYLIATPVIGDAFKSSEVAALLQQNQPDGELLATLIERARQHGLPQIAAAAVIGRGRVVPAPSTRSAPRPPNALPPPHASTAAPRSAAMGDAPRRMARTGAPGGLIAGLSDATVSLIGIITLAAVTLITVLVLYASAQPAAAPQIVAPTASVPAPTEEATVPAEVTLPPTITRAPTEAPAVGAATRTPGAISADKIITATVTVRPHTATPTATRSVAATATRTVAAKATRTATPAATRTIAATATRTVAATATRTAAPTATRTATPTPSVTSTLRPTQTATRTPTQSVTRTPRPTLAATRRPRRTVVATTAPTDAPVPTVQLEATATVQPQPQPQPQPTSPPPQPTSPPPQPTSPPPQPTSPPPIPTALP